MVTNELRGERVDVVPVLRRPGRAHPVGAGPGPGPRGAPRRRDRHRHGDRERLPAVAGHRQGGPERPPGRPPDRLADRHQERDPAGRGGGRLRRGGVGRGRVGRERGRRDGLASRPRAARPSRPREWSQGAEEQAEAEPRATPTPPAGTAPARRRRRRPSGDGRGRAAPSTGEPRPARAEVVPAGTRRPPHSPVRTCIGCRRAGAGGRAGPGRAGGPTARWPWAGRSPGRGAWLSPGRRAVLDQAVANGALRPGPPGAGRSAAAVDGLVALLGRRPVGPDGRPGKARRCDVRG